MTIQSIEDMLEREEAMMKVHRLQLSLADKIRETKGASDEDIAMGAALGALDAATVLMDGDNEAGIAWLRAALDEIEGGQPLTAVTIQ